QSTVKRSQFQLSNTKMEAYMYRFTLTAMGRADIMKQWKNGVRVNLGRHNHSQSLMNISLTSSNIGVKLLL
ncbi:MAG: hypothetical protein AAB212_09250, partial [Bacteroidota bacterium]